MTYDEGFAAGMRRAAEIVELHMTDLCDSEDFATSETNRTLRNASNAILAAIPPAAPDARAEERLNGGRPLPFDRDTGGRMVREAWVRWAETQPNPKPSWLLPYDDLPEPDKEADRQIAEAVGRWTLLLDAAILAPLPLAASWTPPPEADRPGCFTCLGWHPDGEWQTVMWIEHLRVWWWVFTDNAIGQPIAFSPLPPAPEVPQ